MAEHKKPAPLWHRLFGFTLLPAIGAISPLLVLPVVARQAGPEGWTSAIAGESVGTFAAIVIAYGWTTIGPALVSIAGGDSQRGLLYRESLVVRLLIAAVALPAMVLICWIVASPGSELMAVLMGLQGALIGLSFTWLSVGIGEPRAIVIYDAIPRLAAAVIAAVAIIGGAPVVLYPSLGILVTVAGTGYFTVRILKRFPSGTPMRTDIPRLFRTGAPVALNDAATGAYSSVPTPLVAVTAPPTEAAGYASADKMYRLGQFLPLTLANALQSWITEVHGPARGRRTTLALAAHVLLGLIGGVLFGLLGSWASAVLFGPAAQASTFVTIGLGVAFAFFSIRTSMMRHVLFPAGQAHAAMWATLVGTAIGVPAMIVLARPMGPDGVAVGCAATEVIATAILVRRTRRTIRVLREAPPVR